MSTRSVCLVALLAVCFVASASAGDVYRRVRGKVAPGTTEYHFHFGNCLDDMTFVGCHDFVGSWATGKAPTNVTVNSAIDMTIEFPAGGAISGNCTWQWKNSHGPWTFYIDFFVQVGGDSNFGSGSEDAIDDAETDLTTPLPFFNVVCFVGGYTQDGLNACIASLATPAQGCDQWGSRPPTGPIAIA